MNIYIHSLRHWYLNQLFVTNKFYGIKPDFLPEIQTQLEKKVHEIMRYNLHINRNVPVIKIARMMTGPEVRGSRPILVNFAYWKDREEVLSKSRLLRGSNIYVTEDLSRRMRETRHHLTKYMRDVRCFYEWISKYFWKWYIHKKLYSIISTIDFHLLGTRFGQDHPIRSASFDMTSFTLKIHHMFGMMKGKRLYGTFLPM